jgi:hypothetical protein
MSTIITNPVSSSTNPYYYLNTPNAVATSVYWAIVAKREDAFLLLWENTFFLTWSNADSIDKTCRAYLTWILGPKFSREVMIGDRKVVVWWRGLAGDGFEDQMFLRYDVGQSLGVAAEVNNK